MKYSKVDNTNGTVAALENGNAEYLAELSTLLGPKYSLPKAGVIRPGIMVPKKSCSAQDKKAYEEMVMSESSWDEIEKKLGNDAGGKSKLTPANVDYFTINGSDCLNPQNASVVKKLYADPDGKVRRIPVWFPVNEWWNIMPHSLRCWGQSGIRFMSDIKITGNKVETLCRFPLNAEPGKRVFGGRQWGTRTCVPETCSEYQSGDCKFGGMIQFYIPGTKGVGIWVLPTTSWYSMVAIKSVLWNVSQITSGRLARLFDRDGKPVFELTKVRETISSVDRTTGKPVQRTQYLIYLDMTVDMTELALMYESKNLMARGASAASMLANPVITSDDGGDNELYSEPVIGNAPESQSGQEMTKTEEEPRLEEKVEEAETEKKSAPTETEKKAEPDAKKEPETELDPELVGLVKRIVRIKKDLPEATFQSVRTKYPENWKTWNVEHAKKLLEELEGLLKHQKKEAPDNGNQAAAGGNGFNGNGDLAGIIEQIKEKAKSYGVPPTWLDRHCSSLDSQEVALNWLTRLDQGDFSMFYEELG